MAEANTRPAGQSPAPTDVEGALRASDRVDAVVIGRNEGARLVACLGSLTGVVRRTIYVDSGSTDGSVAAAKASGAHVMNLDRATPFTAARARNAGLAAVVAQPDPPEFVLFVDGDCAVIPGFADTATRFLSARSDLALVAGRRYEVAPAACLYNLLCHDEWNTPAGPAAACGGDALIRLGALQQIGGYREDVIAAEDDEMCQRLRAAGWGLWRIDAGMTVHDAALTRFGPWWRRMVRAGYGFAQVGRLHPGHFDAPLRRALFWGAAMPAGVVAGVWALGPLALGGLSLYAMSWARIAARLRARGFGPRAPAAAALIVVSKFANLQGIGLFAWRRLRGTRTAIIEYK